MSKDEILAAYHFRHATKVYDLNKIAMKIFVLFLKQGVYHQALLALNRGNFW